MGPDTAMLLWGLLLGVGSVLVFSALSPHVWPMQPGRVADLHLTLATLEHGGPLLLQEFDAHGRGHSLALAGVGDDEGIYLYVPLLSRLLGVADPLSMVRDLYIALYALAIATYPVIFCKLTRSPFAGAAAPVLLLLCVLSMGFQDIYWVPAWGILTLLPVIYLLARDWPRSTLFALAVAALTAGWLSSIRSQSGLPIAIAAAMVLITRRWRWWRVVAALAMLAALYMSTNTFLLESIRAHSEHRLAPGVLRQDSAVTHPLWNTMYVGLGYLPNSYGLRYRDYVASDRVQQEAPGTPPLSARYSAVIRHAFLTFASEHPLEIVRQYGAKALVTTADAAPYLLLVLLTLPILLLDPEPRAQHLWLLLTLPALIVMFLPSLIAIPLQGYEEGLYATFGVLGILGLCSGLARVQRAVARGGPRLVLAESRRALTFSRAGWIPPRRSVRICCVAVFALFTLSIGAHFVRRSAERWQGQSSGVLIDDLRPGSDINARPRAAFTKVWHPLPSGHRHRGPVRPV